jgi:hypothetical protein
MYISCGKAQDMAQLPRSLAEPDGYKIDYGD